MSTQDIYNYRRVNDQTAHKVRAYLKKYRTGIAELGMTPEQFSREYSVAIRVTPTTLRGW